MILKSKEPPSAVCIWLAPRNDTAEASTNDILAGHWMSAGAQQALVFHVSMFLFLGDGFKYFLCSSLFGEDSQFD